MNDAPEVDVHQPAEVVIGHCRDGGADRYSCVVEDRVHPPVSVNYLGRPRLHGSLLGDIDRGRGDLRAVALARGDGLGEAVAVDVRQRHFGASLHELDGERAANPRPSASDGSNFAGELHRGAPVPAVATSRLRSGFDSTSAGSSSPRSRFERKSRR